jgi:hypothetical protein
VVAAGLVIIVALAAFFTEISGFGFSLKRDLAATKQAATAATRSATEAMEESLRASDEAAATRQTASAAATSAAEAMQTWQQAAEDLKDFGEGLDVALGESPDQNNQNAISQPTRSPLASLAGEYNRIRWTMPSGSERTAAMTSVVNNMISTCRGLSAFDIAGHLKSEDRGLRLAGYAYLFANPEPQYAPDLTEVIFREDKPFGEYWAIRTLRKLVETDPAVLDQNTKRRLEAHLQELPSGSDRANELRDVLRAAA